jgi:transposase InsO family protein
MRKDTTPNQRRAFYTLHQQGLGYCEIAAQYDVSRECVRYWCRRQRDGGSCETVYHKPTTGLLSHFDQRMRDSVLNLRLQHPRLGPGMIRDQLKKEPSLKGLAIPSTAQIGRYLHQWPRFRRQPRKKRKDQRPDPPTQVHQRHQLDFKLNMVLDDGTRVDLHTIRDPVGEVCIGAVLHPTELVGKRTHHVTLDDVRATCRRSWNQWELLPDEVQTDGEPTLVAQSDYDLPSVFTLWLAGLGIKHIVIRSGIPTDNAEVERCHQTIHNCAIVGNERYPMTQLQSILDDWVLNLAFDIPSRAEGCAGRPPMEAHPELFAPRRAFKAEHELALFDLKRVDAFLSAFTWTRKVNKKGQVSLGGQDERYNVGRIHAGQEVLARFDPTDRHFVFYSLRAEQGDAEQTERQEIGRQPARHLEVQDLTGLATWPAGLVPQQLALPLCFVEG